MADEWAPARGYPAYEVSEVGSVRRIDSGRLIKPTITHGYFYMRLSKNGQNRNLRLHRLVWESFTGPAHPFTVDHIDGNKANNCVWNLRLLTVRENCRAASRLGLLRVGEKHPHAKLADTDIPLIRAASAAGEKQRDIASRFGVSQRAIAQIVHRITWRHVNG